MPDDKGNWLPEERTKILKWFNDNMSFQPCTFCGEKKWAFNESGVHLLVYRSGSIHTGGPLIPSVLVFCGKCGHMEFFSPVVMGVMQGDSVPSDVGKSAPSESEVAHAK